MIFVSISSKASDEWWNSQTDEFKRQYLAEHPKSKWANPDYGKDPEPPAKKKKKKKSSTALQTTPKEILQAPKPAPVEDAGNVVDVSTVEKIVPESPEARKELKEAIQDTVEKFGVNNVYAKAKANLNNDDPEKRESAQLAVAAASFLAVIALAAIVPMPPDTMFFLAQNSADFVASVLKESSGKDQPESDKSEPEEIAPGFLPREEEAMRLQELQRRNDMIGLDADGHRKDEEAESILMDSLVEPERRKNKTIAE